MGRTAWLLIVAGLLAGACGGKDNMADDGAPTDATPGDALPTWSLCPAGGSFDFGPVSVTVPEGAVAACTTLVVEEWPEAPPGNLGPAYRLLLTGGTLFAPITLTFRYDPASLPAPYAYNELELARVDDSRWAVLLESAADALSGALVLQVQELGIFGVVPLVRIDLLWVNEDGSCMSQETVVSTVEMERLVKRLAEVVPHLDLQLASVASYSPSGFHRTAQPLLSPAADQPRQWPCKADQDCAAAFGAGWTCSSSAEAASGAVMSHCRAQCSSDADCAARLCAQDLCSGAPACPSPLCGLVDGVDCLATCVVSGDEPGICKTAPVPGQCQAAGSKVLRWRPAEGEDSSAAIPCVLQSDFTLAGYQQSFDDLLVSAWRSLDPAGPNASESALFLRPDALLLVLFLAYEDDTSIAPDFASPGWSCSEDSDCKAPGVCKLDPGFEVVTGKPVKLCHGVVKADYYGDLALLGDYQGAEHHRCAYDLACKECDADSDCPEYWSCSQSGKCLPWDGNLGSAASYQTPPGLPRYALWPPEQLWERLNELKSAPGMVLIGAITGDGLVQPDNQKASLISAACLEHPDLPRCAAYASAKAAASAACLAAPGSAGCEELYDAKLHCLRECSLAAWVGPLKPAPPAPQPYVCEGPYGIAWLGSRYLRLTAAAGDSGLHANLCAPEGIPGAFDRLHDLVVNRLFEQ